jgi:hypothetical protein
MAPDDTTNETSLDYAVREYRRLLDEARREGESWDEQATLRALAFKTGVTLEELRAAIAPSTGG